MILEHQPAEYFSSVRDYSKEEHQICLDVAYKILNHLHKLIREASPGSPEELQHLNKKDIISGIIKTHQTILNNYQGVGKVA